MERKGGGKDWKKVGAERFEFKSFSATSKRFTLTSTLITLLNYSLNFTVQRYLNKLFALLK